MKRPFCVFKKLFWWFSNIKKLKKNWAGIRIVCSYPISSKNKIHSWTLPSFIKIGRVKFHNNFIGLYLLFFIAQMGHPYWTHCVKEYCYVCFIWNLLTQVFVKFKKIKLLFKGSMISTIGILSKPFQLKEIYFSKHIY